LLKVWQVNFVGGKTHEGTFSKRQQLATKDLTRCVCNPSTVVSNDPKHRR
jgi:hypothetical protein